MYFVEQSGEVGESFFSSPERIRTSGARKRIDTCEDFVPSQ
jgi:hypothetical protein